MNNLIFDDEARAKIKAGVDVVSKAVSATIGPKGRNVFIDNDWSPSVVNDGVTVANRIFLDDKFENMGAYVVKQAASATNDEAGDGTTTTTCILQSVIEEGFKASENPMEVKKSLTLAAADAIKMLLEYKTEVTTDEQLKQVATISAENPEDGEIIKNVINEIGKEGMVVVEESSQVETNYEIVHGLQIDEGFLAREMVTSTTQLIAEHNGEVPVMCVISRITVISELKQALDALNKSGNVNVVMFVRDIDPVVLGTLVNNQQILKSLIVQANEEQIEDIASITGATIISEKSGLSFDQFKIEHFGEAKRVVSIPKQTTIVGTQKPEAKIAELNSQRELTKNDYEKEKLSKRVGRLQGGLAVIRVGAPTELEMRHRKLKIDDAVNATKAALKEGIVEGGGITLYRIAQRLPSDTIGQRILKVALKAPITKIIENAGLIPSEIFAKIEESLMTYGFNASTDQVENLYDAGIIDPVLVERCSIQNAVSAGGTVITTAVALTLPQVVMQPRKAQ